jgi:hypothetical protein
MTDINILLSNKEESDSMYIECIGVGAENARKERRLIFDNGSSLVSTFEYLGLTTNHVLIQKKPEEGDNSLEIYSRTLDLLFILDGYYGSEILNNNFIKVRKEWGEDAKKYIFSLDTLEFIYEYNGTLSKLHNWFVVNSEDGFVRFDSNFNLLEKDRFERIVDVDIDNNLLISNGVNDTLFYDLNDFSLKKTVPIKGRNHYTCREDLVVLEESGKMSIWQPSKNRMILDFEHNSEFDNSWGPYISKNEQLLTRGININGNLVGLTWNVRDGSFIGEFPRAEIRCKVKNGYRCSPRIRGYLDERLLIVDYDTSSMGKYYTLVDVVNRKNVYKYRFDRHVINNELNLIVSEKRTYPPSGQMERSIEVYDFKEDKAFSFGKYYKKFIVLENKIIVFGVDGYIECIDLVSMSSHKYSTPKIRSLLVCKKTRFLYARDEDSVLMSIDSELGDVCVISGEGLTEYCCDSEISDNGKYLIIYKTSTESVRNFALFDLEDKKLIIRDQEQISFEYLFSNCK